MSISYWSGNHHMHSSPQHESGSEGRTRILRAAYPLFMEHGYKSVSMQQIADVAQIHKATLYHHFLHKDDLFASVVHLALVEMRAELTAIIDRGGSPAEQLIDAALQIFTRTQSDFGRLMTDMHEHMEADVRIELIKEKYLPWELFRQIIEQAIDAGNLPEVDTELAVGMYVGMVWGQIWMRKTEWVSGPLDRALATNIVHILFRGLGSELPVLMTGSMSM